VCSLILPHVVCQGGLLNATFGNATELIICIFALEDGLLRVVQVSLLGSVLSNMLLVLGCAFLVGGYRHKTQHFNKSAASTNVGMLMLAVMSLSFPAALEASGQAQMAGTTSAEKLGHELELSRWISLVLFTTYGAYLLFQLKTHQYLFEGEDDDEDEEDFLGYWGAIAWLTILTIFIALLSEVLVDAITGAAVDWGVSTIFIGAIIIPIIGNAAEHASAVLFAYRNKMDISLGVAIGSSTQVCFLLLMRS
jgi:Ca2+:H+ antiporter